MGAFGQYGNGHARFQHGGSALKGFIVLPHAVGTIPWTENRKDFQEIEDAGHHCLFKNIGTSQKYHRFAMSKQHSQRIHKGILMVGSEDNLLIGRHIFFSHNNKPAVKQSVENADNKAEHPVRHRIFMNRV